MFIRLENTFEQAMQYRNSPQMSVYSFKGVQLLPNNPLPYIQRTYGTGGVEIESPSEVLLYSICGDVLEDFTPYFFVINTFQDPDTGWNQVDWKLQDVAYDAGDQIVYLRIRQGVNNFIYSSPFVITADNAEYTSRWDYKNERNGTMYSTQLRIWFKQLSDLEEIETYDTLEGRRVGMRDSLIPHEIWQTSINEINQFRLFKEMRRNAYVYCDLAKTVPYDAFETPKLVGRENFGEADILLARDETNLYDPLYVPVVPTPEPPIPTITLTSVTSLNNNQVEYVFSYTNFTPTYLTLQYSLDQVTWTDNTGGINSPRNNNVPNHLSTSYYYRVYHAGTETASNILQLTQPSLVITNMTGGEAFNPDGNKYRIFYNSVNFSPTVQFYFESSLDGITWVPMLYGVTLPDEVFEFQYATTQPSAFEFTHFRMKYSPLGLVSNDYEFTI